jgi:hypothetical protein
VIRTAAPLPRRAAYRCVRSYRDIDSLRAAGAVIDGERGFGYQFASGSRSLFEWIAVFIEDGIETRRSFTVHSHAIWLEIQSARLGFDLRLRVHRTDLQPPTAVQAEEAGMIDTYFNGTLHPEQRSAKRTAFDEITSEPWFDPSPGMREEFAK